MERKASMTDVNRAALRKAAGAEHVPPRGSERLARLQVKTAPWAAKHGCK